MYLSRVYILWKLELIYVNKWYGTRGCSVNIVSSSVLRYSYKTKKEKTLGSKKFCAICVLTVDGVV